MIWHRPSNFTGPDHVTGDRHATAFTAPETPRPRRPGTWTCIAGKWHVWKVVGGIMLSDEDAKKLRDFGTIDELVNWLYLNGEQPAARAINKSWKDHHG